MHHGGCSYLKLSRTEITKAGAEMFPAFTFSGINSSGKQSSNSANLSNKFLPKAVIIRAIPTFTVLRRTGVQIDEKFFNDDHGIGKLNFE